MYNITHQVRAIFILGLDFQEEDVFKGKKERFIEEYKLLELIKEYQSNFGKEWKYVRHTHIYKAADEVGEVEYLQVIFVNTFKEPDLRWMTHRPYKFGYGEKKHAETKTAKKRAAIKAGKKVRVIANYISGEFPERDALVQQNLKDGIQTYLVLAELKPEGLAANILDKTCCVKHAMEAGGTWFLLDMQCSTAFFHESELEVVNYV